MNVRKRTIGSRTIAALAFGLTGAASAVVAWPAPAAIEHVYFASAPAGRPEIIAHGGGLGVRPANTFSALDAAVEMGADVLEVDVQRTADGVLILLHDDTLDRTTDLSGPVAAMTWDEISKADAGATGDVDGVDFAGRGIGVPRLEAAFARHAGMRWIVEIKPPTPQAGEAICAAIGAAGLGDRVLVGSFHPNALQAFRTACPGVATSMDRTEATRFALAARVGLSRFVATPAVALQIPMDADGVALAHPHIVRAAHARGIRVQYWTINELDDMRTLIDLGADGIITDYVERLSDVLSGTDGGRPTENAP